MGLLSLAYFYNPKLRANRMSLDVHFRIARIPSRGRYSFVLQDLALYP